MTNYCKKSCFFIHFITDLQIYELQAHVFLQFDNYLPHIKRKSIKLKYKSIVNLDLYLLLPRIK